MKLPFNLINVRFTIQYGWLALRKKKLSKNCKTMVRLGGRIYRRQTLIKRPYSNNLFSFYLSGLSQMSAAARHIVPRDLMVNLQVPSPTHTDVWIQLEDGKEN